MNTTVDGGEEEDYLDHFSRLVPWQRSLTSLERLLIVSTVATFISIIACILLCVIWSRSPRRWRSRRKLEQHILMRARSRSDGLVVSSPPQYESIIKADSITAQNASEKRRQFGRKPSLRTISEGDVVESTGSDDHLPTVHSQSARSSLSNGRTLSSASTKHSSLPPFTRLSVELNSDTTTNTLLVHLTDVELIRMPTIFAEHAEYFIRVQLLNNKLLKKFQSLSKSPRSRLPLDTWRNQQEQTTKSLSRTGDDRLICDEHLQFQWSPDEKLSSFSLRVLLYSTDRSGVRDSAVESVLCLHPTMAPMHRQTIELSEFPRVTLAELSLGLGYLPTAERLTIKVHQLRYLCKIEKNQNIDARLIATFFHHGRRFFQKKLPSVILHDSSSVPADAYEINDTMTHTIPQADMPSVHVHFELVVCLGQSTDESSISCGSLVLGEHTRDESDWHKLLEQPRSIHLGWYSLSE